MQENLVAVKVYSPEPLVAIAGKTGFATVSVNPLGPVQLNFTPKVLLDSVKNFKSFLAQIFPPIALLVAVTFSLLKSEK